MVRALRLLALSLFLYSTVIHSASFCDPVPGQWVSNWTEEFEGDSLDPQAWNIQVGNADRNIGSCRDAYCDPNNIIVSNGTLIIVSKNETSNGYNYTTGGVTTENKKIWTYSPTYRLCVSAKLPGKNTETGLGLWPAIWLMPNDDSCDPDEGEIDILESIDADGQGWATYHYQTTYPKSNCSYPTGHERVYTSVQLPPDWSTAFHEYAVEHSLTHLAFVYDGVTILNTSVNDPAKPLFWPVPFYLILNTAIGGQWPSNPNASTIFPVYHVIDYVKVVTAL